MLDNTEVTIENLSYIATRLVAPRSSYNNDISKKFCRTSERTYVKTHAHHIYLKAFLYCNTLAYAKYLEFT